MTVPMPIAHHPWPDWRAPARKLLGDMLAQLEGIAITGGEASVRFSAAGIDKGRWLVGFSPVGVASERLRSLPARLGMPAQDAEHFQQNILRAQQIYLAVSQTIHQTQAKVYLEYPLSSPSLRADAVEQRQVDLQIESCKWPVADACDAPAVERTEYWRVSGLDGSAMVQILRDQSNLPAAVHTVYAGLAKVLEQALHSAPDWQGFRMLSVRNVDQDRRGAGLRFYGSEWRVGHAMKVLAPVFAEWGLATEDLQKEMQLRGHQELGWLHAGLDGAGLPYLNIYGALNRVETRAVLSAAGQALAEPFEKFQEKSK
jgi:hypothetical protein